MFYYLNIYCIYLYNIYLQPPKPSFFWRYGKNQVFFKKPGFSESMDFKDDDPMNWYSWRCSKVNTLRASTFQLTKPKNQAMFFFTSRMLKVSCICAAMHLKAKKMIAEKLPLCRHHMNHPTSNPKDKSLDRMPFHSFSPRAAPSLLF